MLVLTTLYILFSVNIAHFITMLKERGAGQTFSISFWMGFSQAPFCRYEFKVIFDYICFYFRAIVQNIYAFDF